MVLRSADLGYSNLLVEPFARALGATPLSQGLGRRISVGEAHMLLQRAVASTGDATLGLRAGCATSHGDVGAFDYAVQTAASVSDGLATAARYMRVVNGELNIVIDPRPGALRVELQSPMLGPAPAEDYLISALYRVHIRRMVPAEGAVTCSFTQRAPQDPGPHRQALVGAKLVFGAATRGFDFDRAWLDLPLPDADPKLHAILCAQLERELLELPDSHAYSERVRAVLRSERPLATTTLPLMAAAIQTSVRTLSRRLQSEGASFGQLLDDVRRQRALALLDAGELSVTEIARDLGFSRGSAFDRAFRRWTGFTPSDHRRGRTTD